MLENHSAAEADPEPIYSIADLGEGLKLTHRRAVELTEQEALNFLEMPEFIADRALDDNHVVFLTRQMSAGTFRWELVGLITCRLGGTTYRMNGQHTCWARSYAKLPRGTRTPVQMLEYTAKSDQDVRQLYATIDRGKARDMRDVIGSYLYGLAEFKDFNKKVLTVLGKGVALWLWQHQHARQVHTGDERAKLLRTDYYKVAMQIGTFLREGSGGHGIDTRHIRKAATVAAMFATYHSAPLVAAAFWATVRDGVGIAEKGDPRLTLRNQLMTTAVASGAKAHDTRTVAAEEMYRWCIMAWNAHRNNKQLKVIRADTSGERPEVR